MCPGGQLNLTCLGGPDETLLTWSLIFPSSSNPDVRFISSRGTAESARSTFTLGQTVFQFSRTSTSPLISLIIIENMTSELNGTRVNCSDSNIMILTTVINIYGNGRVIVSVPGKRPLPCKAPMYQISRGEDSSLSAYGCLPGTLQYMDTCMQYIAYASVANS